MKSNFKLVKKGKWNNPSSFNLKVERNLADIGRTLCFYFVDLLFDRQQNKIYNFLFVIAYTFVYL